MNDPLRRPGAGTDPRERAVTAFRERFGRDPELVARAPGRVNLLGAHVDYSEGWVLPGAIDRSVWIAAAPASKDRLEAWSLDQEAPVEVDLAALPPPLRERAGPATWGDYPIGVAWALAAAGHDPRGLSAVVASDLPTGAGVSSSAALEMAFVLAWEHVSSFELQDAERAAVGQRAENGYLDVQSGIMDQYASVCGRAGHLVFLDCRKLSHQLVPLPPGLGVLVADTGVRRRLAGSDYNDRRRECEQAVEILARGIPGVAALRDVSPAELALHGALLPEILERRARHAVEECDRVRHGAAALAAGDLESFGEAIRASHASSRDLYEVSIPELDVLAEAAWAVDGCVGARLTGAGFGGCVTALATEEALSETAAAMTAAFEERFSRRPDIFDCRIGDGAEIEALS